MVQNEIQERIDELKRQIDSLPSGTVSTKKIKGKVYYYHRVSIDGKRKEIYVPQDEAEELISKINTRKELEKELRQHRAINKVLSSYYHQKRETQRSSSELPIRLARAH